MKINSQWLCTPLRWDMSAQTVDAVRPWVTPFIITTAIIYLKSKNEKYWKSCTYDLLIYRWCWLYVVIVVFVRHRAANGAPPNEGTCVSLHKTVLALFRSKQQCTDKPHSDCEGLGPYTNGECSAGHFCYSLQALLPLAWVPPEQVPLVLSSHLVSATKHWTPKPGY